MKEVAKEAIRRARRGEGPTLVECETYRFRGHSLADTDELHDPGEFLLVFYSCIYVTLKFVVIVYLYCELQLKRLIMQQGIQ